MALWRRQPSDGETVLHFDHGTQFTSWAFGRRLRTAGLRGSMGSIGDCYPVSDSPDPVRMAIAICVCEHELSRFCRADTLDRGRDSFGRQAWGDVYARLSAADLEEPLEFEDPEPNGLRITSYPWLRDRSRSVPDPSPSDPSHRTGWSR